MKKIALKFQSTRPMRGATRRGLDLSGLRHISIHAPHAGRDELTSRSYEDKDDFNPRAPCGARRSSLSASSTQPNFNPRAPCGARLR